MITVVPPYGDPSLRLAHHPEDGELLDITVEFVAELVAAAEDGKPFDGAEPADRGAALMRTAGTAALGNRHADTVHRLRGLGPVLASLATPAHGVHLRLDDLELTEGTTQSSADVLRAAAAPAPYQAALARAADHARTHREVTVVIERDQQLPAALWLLGELRAAPPRTVRVTGRYATACWPVLRTLPPCADATLAPTPRGLPWLVVDPFRPDAPPGLRWRERAADPRPHGPWAGRVALRHVLAGDAAGARTAVLGLCASGERVLGRGGSTATWPELARAVEVLRAQGTRVLAEVWIGAPGCAPDEATRGLRAVADTVDRVAGLCVFDWPVGWTTPRWGPYPVTYEKTGHDLARHHSLRGQPPPAELTALVTALAGPLARAGELVPGRVAAAYLSAPPARTGPGLGLDPDVVLGAHSARTGKGIAVNLRTGACTKIGSEMTALLTRPPARRADAVRAVLAALPGPQLSALRDGDVLVGVA
ncbi:hypothetical protein OYE22_31340 [Streptomyces sp. 71268]|uniref:hypothetical protein n=1 Tax=Streptomyces sp. 71268 TaxID=3002640 RepID=UPI0023F741A9|nr:hypothetical protein [Streptomyces sp. 71268]WEV29183.1 hypothetical protein OYE22_31340 [Streptomyces sp. 71268]